MDMDLVIIFAFVTSIVLIIVGGIVLFPIARKLGYFLEQAARDRAERSLGRSDALQLPPAAHDELLHALSSLETRVAELAERQKFSEDLLEERSSAGLGDSHPRIGPD